MSVLSRLSNRGAEERLLSLPWPSSWGGYLSGYGQRGYQSAAGTNQVEQSLQVVAVYACIRVISNSVSTLPLCLYRDVDGEREKLDQAERVVKLLARYPHPRIRAGELYGLIAAHLAGWGNAYVFKGRKTEGGPVTSLFPILPSMVSVSLDANGDPEYTVTMPNGDRVMRSPDILHIRGFGVDGILGMSPITVARKAIESMELEEDYRINLLRNDARVSGILSTDKDLSPEAAVRLKAAWDGAHGGPQKAGGTAVLEGGMKWQQLSLSTEDMQFIEQRNYSVAEIARLFGVPPSKINAQSQDSMTYSTVESENLAYVADCLMPYLRRIEEALDGDTDLVPDPVIPEFHVDSLMRAEAGARAAFYSTMITAGVMTRDEARVRENLPKLEGPAADELTGSDVSDDAPSVAETEDEV